MLIHTRQYLVLLYTFVVLATVVASLAAVDDDFDDESKFCTGCDEAFVNRQGFPHGFVFGAASAAYQVEGAYNVTGKGQSMWDNFTHTYPDRIQDHTNGDVAIDSYHLYKEDVRLLKNLGMNAYKLSISWPRILPGGSLSKGVNPNGINYYNNLIDELLANGIEPWVTIFHLDIPQALEDAYGGFLSSKIVEDFRDFAEVLFREFGDRVKNWITINEPWCFSTLAYARGVFAPARCSDWITGRNCTGGDSATEPYIVTHNQLLAHAAAVKLYRDKYQKEQKGKIGITANSFWFVPYNRTPECVEAKYRMLDFMLGWVIHPITFGSYPKRMRERAGDRLPEFTTEEVNMVKGSMDFLGLNYYSTVYARIVDVVDPNHVSYSSDSGAVSTGVKDRVPIGDQGSKNGRYYIVPMGLRKLLRYIKENYNDPLIYITENGLDMDRDDSIPMSQALNDYKRKKYLFDHLCCVHESIKQDGVNVKGFFVWSLADHWEWISGYSTLFGLHYVDPTDKTLTRHPKLSAEWIKSILTQSVENSQPQLVSDE